MTDLERLEELFERGHAEKEAALKTLEAFIVECEKSDSLYCQAKHLFWLAETHYYRDAEDAKCWHPLTVRQAKAIFDGTATDKRVLCECIWDSNTACRFVEAK